MCCTRSFCWTGCCSLDSSVVKNADSVSVGLFLQHKRHLNLQAPVSDDKLEISRPVRASGRTDRQGYIGSPATRGICDQAVTVRAHVHTLHRKGDRDGIRLLMTFKLNTDRKRL